jgi:hypothetical protein
MSRDGSKWDGPHSYYPGTRTYHHSDEPFLCWNCEIDITLNSAPADAVMHFCSPSCKDEWWASQPLANLIEKHRRKKRSTE